jgi:hypothetical protein
MSCVVKRYTKLVFLALCVLVTEFNYLSSLESDPRILTARSSRETSTTGFVTANRGYFYDANGNQFRFAGSNAYYLFQYQYYNPTLINNTLDMFEANNITVVRTWAFFDGSNGVSCGVSTNGLFIQTAPGVYSSVALSYLDRVVAECRDRNIKLIMAFTNFWGDFGGICQYNVWAGLPAVYTPDSASATFFYTNSTVQGWYRNYISMLLNRVNTYTGVQYKNDPTILAWEIMNEPRWPGQANGTALRDWLANTAAFIKSIDSNHMVSTGEEGFDQDSPSVYTGTYSNTYWMRTGTDTGSSYLLNVQIPDIDFATAHLYPFGFGFSDPIADGTAYIYDHMNVAIMFEKPFILEEYGYDGPNASTPDCQQKIDTYLAWWNVTQYNATGDLCWEFVYDNTECGALDICLNRDPILVGLLHQHANIMASVLTTSPIVSPSSPTSNSSLNTPSATTPNSPVVVSSPTTPSPPLYTLSSPSIPTVSSTSLVSSAPFFSPNLFGAHRPVSSTLKFAFNVNLIISSLTLMLLSF